MNKIRKNIVLIGGGGHCKSCIEVIESTEAYNIIGILDLPAEFGKKVLDYQVIGNDDDYEKFHLAGCCFLITTGQIKSAEVRKRIFSQLNILHAEIETVIASTATVSKYSIIGKGTIVMHHCFINAGAQIDENCIINTASVIEHDVVIKSHCHISTKTIINGDCKIGSETFIGSSSCVSNGVNITNNVIIGAGSLVLNKIEKSGTYFGNPVEKK
ncbi:acetyltransferase [Kaistella jeonii]|uniref:Acetyltransferase n=1 Tax=Kaistella jeonii TaxID=266749 RepID=A0A0C1CXQ7_9FLAO|nr:acetyltransferase [Kaistella jeonii]KIA89126.1 acetyltransferase [Kaistella jeonii]SFB93778.1 sugar O-acyltransferase, sialic acid O-acetyltransferase NeuD family [Kaistella jeonii]VEI97059.1 UDP-3-O-[3-hydroxymyristoyl] glucosamine N-acyltransferase [Kaistella jeonii]